MARGTALAEIHPAVEAGINGRDLEGLVALYAPDASLMLPDGSTVTGTAAIREQYAGLLEMTGHITVRSRFATEAGDLALLSNEWTFTVGDQSMSAVSAEVARREPDGSWLYVVDHPYASLEPAEAAEIVAAMVG
jgi:ketosteroid isomerase-like protein